MLHLIKELEIQKRLVVETEQDPKVKKLNALILEHAGKLSAGDIGKLAGYRAPTVKERANEMRVSLATVAPPPIYDDLDFVIKKWAGMRTGPEIAVMTGKPHSTVKNRACRLGLSLKLGAGC